MNPTLVNFTWLDEAYEDEHAGWFSSKSIQDLTICARTGDMQNC
jgi:hypothetical protein